MKQNKKRYIRKAESEFLFSLELKYCSKCGQIKELDKFNKDKSCRDGLASWCKKCTKNYKQSKKGKKAQKKSQEKYYENNKKTILKKIKEYRQQPEPKKKILIRKQTRRKWGAASAHLCARCKQKAAQWHHQRYDSKWQEGCVPLCLECHKKIPKVCETFQE